MPTSTNFQAGETVVSRIQNRRGNRVDLPQPLEPGELGWCLDTKQLFIGLTEEDAVAGLEIYRGGTVNAQPLVQSIIDTQLIEFNTLWSRLNATVQLIQDPATSVSEETLLVDLRSIPSSIFVDSQKRVIIDNIEQNIEIVSRLNQDIKDSLGGPAGFANQALITYDWEKQDSASGSITINAAGGIITGVSSIGLAGLGYIPNPISGSTVELEVVSGSTAGLNATFTATISTDGAGTIDNIFVANGGTGYVDGETLVLEVPSQEAIQATADATSTNTGTGTLPDPYNGIIDSALVTFAGAQYAGIPEITVTDASGAGAVISAIVVGGELVALNIDAAGSGYSGNPVIEIQEPKSNTLYKFTYDFGVEDKPGVKFSIVGDLGPPVVDEDFDNLSDSIVYLDAITDIESVGVLGLAPSTDIQWTFNPRGNEMVNGFLLLDTSRQSSNVASIINEISTSSAGLVTTKQNVEIITEFSAQELSPDILFEAPIAYELQPSAAFVKITNDVANGGTGVYSFLDLEYSASQSDSQDLGYSTYLDSPTIGYSSSGKLLIITNSTVTGNLRSQLSDNSTEVRSSSGIASLNDGGPDVQFKAVYNASRDVVELEYKHDFPANIILKVTSRRWKSF